LILPRERLRDEGDAVTAFQQAEEAIRATSKQTQTPFLLANLGNIAMQQYARTGKQVYLDQSILMLLEASDGTPEDSPRRSHHLFALASAYFIDSRRDCGDGDSERRGEAFRTGAAEKRGVEFAY
jgi:hypothetical protein